MQSRVAILRPLRSLGILGILGLSTLGCGADSGVTSNPINNRITQSRTMTPRVQPFSELDNDNQPISESVIATFVLTPDQLTQVAQASTEIPAQTIGSCRECVFDPDPQPSEDRETKRLGTYEPDDLSLQLQLGIPESTSVGEVSGSIRFKIDTDTQLLNPGYGAQLKILKAVLQDAAESPEQQLEATELSDPVDFPEKEITKGQSSTRSVNMTFGEVPFETRYLHLEVMLTSPIPRQDREGKAVAPPGDKIYHSLWLGSDPKPEQITAHKEQLGRSLAWIGFTHTWTSSSTFPQEQATSIRSQGSVPYLQLVLPETGEAADAIRSGEQDEAIRTWGEAIRSFKSPVILGIGPTEATSLSEGSEVTSSTTYGYVVTQLQKQQIPNLTWVYHPDLKAEDLSQAYVGDSLIDWIALDLSVDPNSEDSFQSQLDELYPRVAALSARKPIALTSMGLTRAPQEATQVDWLESSVAEVISRRWPRLIGFAWDGSSVALQDTPEITEILKQTIESSEAVLERVIVETPRPTAQPSPSGSATPRSEEEQDPVPDPIPNAGQEREQPISPQQIQELQQQNLSPEELQQKLQELQRGSQQLTQPQ